MNHNVDVNGPNPGGGAILRNVTGNGAINNDVENNEMTEREKLQLIRKNETTVYSCMYGILLTTVGALIYVNFDSPETVHVCEVFSSSIAVVGLLWLLFLSIDIYRSQKKVQTEATTPLLPSGAVRTPGYLFLTGRHSRSVYLKVGLTAFFAGHLINEGLMLIQEFLDFTLEDRVAFGCGSLYSLIHHITRITYSFYQYCVVFKCSNIIINRNKPLARWAVMHIFASCLCFWFSIILEEALEDFHHQKGINDTAVFKKNTIHLLTSGLPSNSQSITNSSVYECADTALLSENNLSAMPHLFPFTIEFNILLAGVWFIVWLNIGKHDWAEVEKSMSQEERNMSQEAIRSLSREHSGIDVTFHGNMIIFADCQAAYIGLFAGMGVLISSIILLIVFFVEISLGNEDIACNIHNVNECVLVFLALVGVFIGCWQLSKLDFGRHSVYIDDVLLFIPLPFYFIHTAMIIISEVQEFFGLRAFVSLFITVQVIFQTHFIIKSLRRCSNNEELRNDKPGKQVITFLTACNLTLWIINTFETKRVESYYGQHMYFSQFVWLLVSHTTLPFKLFYRFHSSACLADIWASAYNKEE